MRFTVIIQIRYEGLTLPFLLVALCAPLFFTLHTVAFFFTNLHVMLFKKIEKVEVSELITVGILKVL